MAATMTSLRQIEANRRNALRSTGPKTDDGKQHASRNAVRRGLTAETVITPLEDPRASRKRRLGSVISRATLVEKSFPLISEVEDTFKHRTNLYLDEIFREKVFLLNVLAELEVFSSEFTPPPTSHSDHDYAWENAMFSYSDAMAYYCMVRRTKPSTIVELGSGASTLIAAQAIKANGFGKIICIEPFPQPFLKTLPDIELLETRAQDLTTYYLNSVLGDGDMLFIDTTHTVRHNSDCLHIYLRLLPFLDKDLNVHVHDIWLPNTLPLDMLRDKRAPRDDDGRA